MTRFAAFLRAVNVGGTGKLPMEDLKALCLKAGFDTPRTYIASGNVVFEASGTARDAKTALEAALQDYAGKAVPVFVRTASQIDAILAANPFGGAAGNKVVYVLTEATPTQADLDLARNRSDEICALGPDGLFIHYPSGMGRSKLRLPVAEAGTARNMNTIAKIAGMLRG